MQSLQGSPVSSARAVTNSIFHLQMSETSENDSSSHLGCDSDGEFSVSSSYGSEVQKSPAQHESQDCKNARAKRHPAGKEGLAAATEYASDF